MRKILFLSFLFLSLFPALSQASPIQQAHCTATTTCSFTNSVTQGDLLLAVGQTTAILTDSQANTWTRRSFQGWYGAYDSLYSAQASATGSLTVTFQTAAADVTLLEYPSATFDQSSSAAWNCCNYTWPVGPLTTAGASELLILVINHQISYTYAVSGFNVDDAGFGYSILDESVTPGSYSAIVPQGIGGAWGAQLFAFQFLAPPPPNVALTVNSSSSALFDDGTPILPGPITISQQHTPTSTANIGVITSDASGNLSGSISVNPNWADANGNLTFLFGLPLIPNIISYPVPVGEFQHSSTGLTINLVLFKQGTLAIKSQTLAVTP